jgi:hypothetical protein
LIKGVYCHRPFSSLGFGVRKVIEKYSQVVHKEILSEFFAADRRVESMVACDVATGIWEMKMKMKMKRNYLTQYNMR